MEVILREDIDKVGVRGQVVKVAAGFARNYLLPKRLAVAATGDVLSYARALAELESLYPARIAPALVISPYCEEFTTVINPEGFT